MNDLLHTYAMLDDSIEPPVVYVDDSSIVDVDSYSSFDGSFDVDMHDDSFNAPKKVRLEKHSMHNNEISSPSFTPSSSAVGRSRYNSRHGSNSNSIQRSPKSRARKPSTTTTTTTTTTSIGSPLSPFNSTPASTPSPTTRLAALRGRDQSYPSGSLTDPILRKGQPRRASSFAFGEISSGHLYYLFIFDSHMYLLQRHSIRCLHLHRC